MIKFALSILIYRPLHQVFAFVSTPENDFHWQYGTLLSTQISKGELGVGTLFRAVSHFLGRRMESVYEVTEFKPDQKYAFKSQTGPLVSHTLYTFELMQGSTRITVSTQLSPGTLLSLNDTSTEKKLKKQYRENLALLKDLLEARPTESPFGATALVAKRGKSDFR